MEQLGQGGMATVYKAYHASLDRFVALKVLHPAFSEDKTFEMRFQREARVVARLEHPNIVPVYDYAEHDRRPYLVMKFIEGETLKARLGRTPLTADEIGRVVDSVGSALSYAHSQGILHRDIKPSNVLIAADGAMYLADFGLARIVDATESTLSSDSIMGTPQYISPEQAMGTRELDEGTDIYSFGVMLYEMVVGQVPFNADTPFSIIHDHIYSPLPLPRAVNPLVPEPVERVLLKSLAKLRSDRYKSVAAMIQAFKQAWSAAGIPMQGSALTLSQTAMGAGASNAATGSGLGQSQALVAVATPAGKRASWMLMAGVVVILLCLLFAASAFRRGRLSLNPLLASPAIPTVAVPVATPTRLADVVPISLPTALPPAPTAFSPVIAAALEKAEANPTDPDLCLELALVYWDAGQERPALEALKVAADLAGQDRDFLTGAALEFASRSAWLPASSLYVRLIRTFPADEQLPSNLALGLHESIYKAAREADIPAYLPFDSLEPLDHPLDLVARGRFALYNGRVREARLLLSQVRPLELDLPEAGLLEAEILIKEGRIDEAHQLLAVIASDPGLADWLRILAGDLLKELP
jgi:tRNA A-37 threonylcarbamoyl transferase component Bud32/cytochrome c-type biogenesis protein CcmH/NrfG